MRGAMVRVAAGAALWCAASCLNIKDVVQPADVEAGKKFEVAVEVRAHGGSRKSEGAVYAGVLAVSIPDGAEVLKASFEGAAKGRLERVAAVPAGGLPERPGYTWVYWITPDAYDGAEYVAKDYKAKLTVRAPDAAGDYVLGYAAGVVTPVGPEGNYDCIYWGKPWQGDGREPALERGITVK
jgi:hypothetical protein